jgi:hypothetical protein
MAGTHGALCTSKANRDYLDTMYTALHRAQRRTLPAANFCDNSNNQSDALSWNHRTHPVSGNHRDVTGATNFSRTNDNSVVTESSSNSNSNSQDVLHCAAARAVTTLGYSEDVVKQAALLLQNTGGESLCSQVEV